MLSMITASAGSTTLGWDSLSTIVTSITGQFSTTTVIAVIAGVIASCIAFVFLWWGARKALRAILGAVKKGRANV